MGREQPKYRRFQSVSYEPNVFISYIKNHIQFTHMIQTEAHSGHYGFNLHSNHNIKGWDSSIKQNFHMIITVTLGVSDDISHRGLLDGWQELETEKNSVVA